MLIPSAAPDSASTKSVGGRPSDIAVNAFNSALIEPTISLDDEVLTHDPSGTPFALLAKDVEEQVDGLALVVKKMHHLLSARSAPRRVQATPRRTMSTEQQAHRTASCFFRRDTLDIKAVWLRDHNRRIARSDPPSNDSFESVRHHRFTTVIRRHSDHSHQLRLDPSHFRAKPSATRISPTDRRSR